VYSGEGEIGSISVVLTLFLPIHTFAVVPLFRVQGDRVHLNKVDEDTFPVVQNRVDDWPTNKSARKDFVTVHEEAIADVKSGNKFIFKMQRTGNEHCKGHGWNRKAGPCERRPLHLA
jgi:hypothetical protein